MKAPLRPCATPHCPTLVRKGHCPAHAKERSTQHRHSLHPGYNTAAWQRLRDEVKAAHPYCARCPNLTEVADHIVPAWAAPHRFYDRTNLQGLCQSCNRTKATEDAQRYTRQPLPTRASLPAVFA